MKIVGHLRLFNKQRNVIGFYIKPIEDFNEVTHHLVETIFGHLALTKGIPLVSETNNCYEHYCVYKYCLY